MVTRRFTVFLTGCLLFVSLSLHAVPNNTSMHFTATVSAKEVQYGKSITLTLTVVSTRPTLSSIDLSELEKHFHVHKKADVDEQSGSQRWKVRLSPYNVGKVAIPSLYFNQLRSQPIELNVRTPIDTKTGTPIKVSTHLSSQQPWMREQVLLSYHLQTQFPRAQIKVAATKSANTIVQPLDTHHEVLEKDQQSPHHYKTGWAMFPLKAGELKINLPPVELIRDGVTTHRFYYPPIELDVQALPLYIPATIPVGELKLDSKKRQRFLIQNSLADYRFSLIGNNILANNLPEMSNQINSTGAIRIYPETKQTSQANLFHGISSRVDYNFPIKVLDQGHTSLDNLKLNYFDSSSGTLQTRFYPNLSVLSINKWLAWLLGTIILILFAYAGLKLTRWITKNCRKLNLSLHAIKQLKTSCTPEELKASISFFSRANGYTENITVDNWFETLTGKYIKVDKLRDEVRRQLYKQRPASIPQNIREEILTVAVANTPVLRLFNRFKLLH